ncbi:hypothetical protein ONS96_010657 [Cadophora gregata f. sp. sojae]|nr:hypothetical protein ONS96_010657 [Cadophora gregata f. sp. sojae]
MATSTMSTSDPSTSNRDRLTSDPVPANPFTFPTGDTKILVTYQGSKIEGLVASQSLCQASPVWKNFIYPPWSIQVPGGGGSVSGGRKVIDCCEDDWEALLVLMNIIHTEFQKVPETLPNKTLYQVAFLCEQYQCVRIVAPWVDGWVDDQNGTFNAARWLYIYWAFGYKQEFEDTAVESIDYLRYDDSIGKWSCEKQPIEEPLPPGILESLLQLRASRIDQLLKVTYDQLTRYELSDVCKIGTQKQHHAFCDALVLGSFIQELRAAGLYPRKQTSDFDGLYFLELKKTIRHIAGSGLDNDTFHKIKGLDIDNHSGCTLSMDDFVKTVPFEDDSSVVLDSHRQHMRTQQENLGYVGATRKLDLK